MNTEDLAEWGPTEGLTPEDVLALVALVREKTSDRILSIVAQGNGAEIMTGNLSHPLAGDGNLWNCERTQDGWRIEDAGQWIS